MVWVVFVILHNSFAIVYYYFFLTHVPYCLLKVVKHNIILFRIKDMGVSYYINTTMSKKDHFNSYVQSCQAQVQSTKVIGEHLLYKNEWTFDATYKCWRPVFQVDEVEVLCTVVEVEGVEGKVHIDFYTNGCKISSGVYPGQGIYTVCAMGKYASKTHNIQAVSIKNNEKFKIVTYYIPRMRKIPQSLPTPREGVYTSPIHTCSILSLTKCKNNDTVVVYPSGGPVTTVLVSSSSSALQGATLTWTPNLSMGTFAASLGKQIVIGNLHSPHCTGFSIHPFLRCSEIDHLALTLDIDHEYEEDIEIDIDVTQLNYLVSDSNTSMTHLSYTYHRKLMGHK